jgi:nucleotidyltransferase substrate binding protein (TIGR01987 family)
LFFHKATPFAIVYNIIIILAISNIFFTDFFTDFPPQQNIILEVMENKLNISALKAAAAAFYNALAFANKVEAKAPADRDPYEFETVRASLIKHFEICYELCWKTMLRFIKEDNINDESSILTKKDLFRISAERGLIAEFDHWLAYHNARNTTSHVYDLIVASGVYQTAKTFADDLREFVETMEKRI